MKDQHRKELLRTIEQHLHRFTYPVSRDELCEHFRTEGTGDDFFELVRSLKKEEYPHAAGILEELRRIMEYRYE